MERLPEARQPINAIEAEELRDAVGEISRTVQLQIHRHGITTKREENALAEAEQTGETPDQIDTEGHNRQREKSPQKVEPEDRQHSWCGDDRRNDQHPKKS